jgi:hypothetical protein
VDLLGAADVPEHVTSEIANGSKVGIDAMKKLPGDRITLSPGHRVAHRRQGTDALAREFWLNPPARYRAAAVGKWKRRKWKRK